MRLSLDALGYIICRETDCRMPDCGWEFFNHRRVGHHTFYSYGSYFLLIGSTLRFHFRNLCTRLCGVGQAPNLPGLDSRNVAKISVRLWKSWKKELLTVLLLNAKEMDEELSGFDREIQFLGL